MGVGVGGNRGRRRAGECWTVAPAMVTRVASSPLCFFFSSRRRHTRLQGDWSSDVCSSDLIGKYLGAGYTVKATVGHVRDLPQRKLGVDVDNGFTPEYVPIKEKAKTLAEIKKAAKASSRVLIATDPDREGEAIAWHVAESLGNGGKVSRVLFHEITKDAVTQALANPLDIDQKKVDAQQARRVLDRLVGYKTSPLLWKSIKTGLSAGRVGDRPPR